VNRPDVQDFLLPREGNALVSKGYHAQHNQQYSYNECRFHGSPFAYGDSWIIRLTKTLTRKKDPASGSPNKSTQQRHQEKDQKDIEQYFRDTDCRSGDSQETECRSD
jgi:hypothetical protein